jgi:SpoVK/Ycf46/Vps4 family AAA+-type ATPase
VDDIGGLENLKLWMDIRKNAFTRKAREFGLPTPRGILLVGLPGCGKSLSAKATSNALGVPLIRFDIGRVFGGLVGQSEQNMRMAIQTIEAIGNCVVWIDELEKAFAGAGGSGASDSGVTQRVFGTFITWMQENDSAAFIVATVNRIESLPPELLRKGRFDEIFFVNLPGKRERETIFDIHIRKRDRDSKNFDINALAEASEDFSGAEIEEAVITGLYSAFYDEARELKTEDIVKAVKETVPLAVSAKSSLDAMKTWAQKNAVNASKLEGKLEQALGRQLDI